MQQSLRRKRRLLQPLRGPAAEETPEFLAPGRLVWRATGLEMSAGRIGFVGDEGPSPSVSHDVPGNAPRRPRGPLPYFPGHRCGRGGGAVAPGRPAEPNLCAGWIGWG